jgi:hypothetical protein
MRDANIREVLLPQRVRERLGYDVRLDVKCFDARLRSGKIVKGVLVIGGAAMFGTVSDSSTPPDFDPEEIVAVRNWGSVRLRDVFKRWVPVA